MKIIETGPREIGFVLWGHCQNLLDGPRIIDLVNDVIRHRKGSEPTGWQAFAEGLRDMNIPQDVVGNRERWDWMHRAPETPETDYITPKQKRTIRKTASRIPVSVRSAKSLGVRKRIKDHFSSPALLSATKKRIKEVFFSMGQLQRSLNSCITILKVLLRMQVNKLCTNLLNNHPKKLNFKMLETG